MPTPVPFNPETRDATSVYDLRAISSAVEDYDTVAAGVADDIERCADEAIAPVMPPWVSQSLGSISAPYRFHDEVICDAHSDPTTAPEFGRGSYGQATPAFAARMGVPSGQWFVVTYAQADEIRLVDAEGRQFYTRPRQLSEYLREVVPADLATSPWPSGTTLAISPNIPFAIFRTLYRSTTGVADVDPWVMVEATSVIASVTAAGCTPIRVSIYPGCENFCSVPSSWLVPWTPAHTAELKRVRNAPHTAEETRALQRRANLLASVAGRWYRGRVDLVVQKFVELMRGHVTHDDNLRTDRFRERISALRGAERASSTPVDESIVARVDQQLKCSPPRLWPKGFDFPGDMVGIEMEFITPRGYRRPDIFGVGICYDGSVEPHNDSFQRTDDSEARMAVRFGHWQRLEKACAALQAAGCVANKTCGLHVHIDMRGRTEQQVRVIARRLASSLPFLNCLVPESRWRSDHAERYCRQGYSFRSRYYAINGCSFREHETLEVRLFSGSLNPDKIRLWVELLWWLAHRTGPNIRSMDAFLSCRAAPAHLKHWAIARWKQLYPMVQPAQPVEVSEQ